MVCPTRATETHGCGVHALASRWRQRTSLLTNRDQRPALKLAHHPSFPPSNPRLAPSSYPPQKEYVYFNVLACTGWSTRQDRVSVHFAILDRAWPAVGPLIDKRQHQSRPLLCLHRLVLSDGYLLPFSVCCNIARVQ